MLSSRAVQARALTAVVMVALAGCAPRARMCHATSECKGESACVAGRCQLDKATVKPAVDSARRLVVRPVDLGFVSTTSGPANGGAPALFALGHHGGKLFLRFSTTLPPAANIVEAYVVLRRASVVDDDPTTIALHAARIVQAWSSESLSWPLQPRVLETRAPSSTVEPAGAPLVRVDVRDLVRQWARRDPEDHGIAILAEGESKTGTTFALDSEPFLEVYVR